jgi:branched-chain amino acid transport system permease protein
VKVPKLISQPRDVQYKILGLIAGDGKQPNPMTAMFCLVVVVILCYAVANLRRSATGRRMLATRSNERAAAASGVNVSGMKILAFAVSAFIAGVGGAVSAYRFGSVTPDKFSYVQSLTFFAFAYLGGIASVYGSISGGFLVAGGLVFTFLSEKLGVPSEFTLILGGLGLIIASVQNPEGISGAIRNAGFAMRARFRPPGVASAGIEGQQPPTADAEKVGTGS